MKTMRKISVVVLMFYYTTGVDVYANFPCRKSCANDVGAGDIKVSTACF